MKNNVDGLLIIVMNDKGFLGCEARKTFGNIDKAKEFLKETPYNPKGYPETIQEKLLFCKEALSVENKYIRSAAICEILFGINHTLKEYEMCKKYL